MLNFNTNTTDTRVRVQQTVHHVGTTDAVMITIMSIIPHQTLDHVGRTECGDQLLS